jgi:hypothetical protein
MLPVEQPFKTYTGLDGKPLDNGYIYFGQPGQEPGTHPVEVYWDAAGTIPAAQPLRTVNGYIVRGGTPANVFFDGVYSELVLDSKRRQVFYARTSAEFSLSNTVNSFIQAMQLANYTELRAYAGTQKMVFVTGYLATSAPSGISGTFVRDDSDTTSLDNGGTVIVASNGKRWKRVDSGELDPHWFGAVGDGVTNDTAAFQAAIDYAALNGSSKVVRARTARYVVDQLHVRFGVALVGASAAHRGMPGDWIDNGANGVTRTGTDFITNAGLDSTDHEDALIFMHPQAKVANINVWYAGQTTLDDPEKIVVYAPTIAVTSGEDGNSDNCVIENISALNCYEFLRIGDEVNSVGRTIVTDCFANPFGPVGIKCRTMNGDVAMFSRVYVQNLFTINPVHRPNLYDFQRQRLIAFDLGYSQGVNLTDCVALSCNHGVSVTHQTWAQITNCLFDYCAHPVYANGADRVFLTNCAFIKNVGAGHCIEVLGTINHLSFTNCTVGDPYSSEKTGIFCKHSSGTVKVVGCTFTLSSPAILNAGAGAVQVSASGIGYDKVTGENIAIDGGPPLIAGASLGIANINPTWPAAAGWTYNQPDHIGTVPGGIHIQGAGNNSITFRPASISPAEAAKIFWGVQIYCLQFSLKVTGQSGSPKLEILVLNDELAVAADAFQVSQDVATSDSGLPEGETFKVSIILPWSGDASQIRFNLLAQSASTSYEITNMDIKQVVLPRGYTGLEWFAGKTKLPLGAYDPQTGGRVWRFPGVPTGGTWAVGDRTIHLNPAIGAPKAWTCVAAGSPGTWASEGNLS